MEEPDARAMFSKRVRLEGMVIVRDADVFSDVGLWGLPGLPCALPGPTRS